MIRVLRGPTGSSWTVWRPVVSALSFLLMTAMGVMTVIAPPAAAATLVMRDGATVGCVVLQELAGEYLVEEVGDDGARRQRTISRSDVTDVIRPVSAKRLEGLSPASPNDYRLYAEELAVKRKDPEAREMAIRLYLIAAFLEPEKLGRGSLLGMAKLAYSPAEATRFRAMAFLLDPAHDRRVLVAPKPGNDLPVDAMADDMLVVVRLLRTGRKPEAKRWLAEKPALQARLESMAPPETVEQLLNSACLACENGFVNCPGCDGTGKAGAGRCTQCVIGRRSIGRVRCDRCGGKFKAPPLTREQLKGLVAVELMVAGKLRAPVSPLKWSSKVAGEKPARDLNLRSITAYDPQLHLFRDGKWVAP